MSGDVPVVLKCENEFVAVPNQTLIQESQVFKAMLCNEENSLSSNESSMNTSKEKKQDSESENDFEKIYERIRSKLLWKIQEREEDTELDGEYEEADNNDEHNNKRKASVDSASIINKKQKGEFKNNREKFNIIDISGFQPKAVKTLFEYLKGYTELMEKSCCSVKVEMLALCDQYVIESPIHRIKADIKKTKLSADNLLDANNAASNLLELDQYNGDAGILKNKIYTFSSNHFSSWRNIVEFILKNKSSMDSIVQIFKETQTNSMTDQWFKVSFEDWDVKRKLSFDSFVLKNIQWTFETFVNEDIDMVVFIIKVGSPKEYKEWSCKASLTFSFFNYQTGQNDYSKSITHVFDNSNRSKEINFMSLINWNSLGDKVQYWKNDIAIISVKVIVDKSEMLPDVKGIPLELLGWDDEEIQAWKRDESKEVQAPQIKEMEFCALNMPVVLNCDGYLITIPFSLLVKESTYFESKFSAYWNRKGAENCVDPSEEQDITEKPKVEMEVIKITGYNSLAVRALFDFLQGYKNLLETCDKFSVLVDMLKLCDFYGIQRPIRDIIDRMNMLPIDLSNLVDALEFSKKLEIFEHFNEVPPMIVKRCITYARGNLFSWRLLMKLVVDNSHRNDLVVGLLEQMCEKKEATIRMKLNLVDIPIGQYFKRYSNYFIFNLFKWRIRIKIDETEVDEWDMESEGMNYEIQMDKDDFDEQLTLEMKIYNQDGTCLQDSIDRYIDGGILFNSVFQAKLDYLTDDKNGFLTQDGNALIELKISTD